MPEALPMSSTIETWTQGYEAWRDLLVQTRHCLSVLDHDLTGFHPDRGHWPDALLACVRCLAPGQCRILVRDEQTLLTRMPRTRQLLIDYGHIVQLRKIAPQHAHALQQSLVMSDHQHALLRPQFDSARAFLRWNTPADCVRHMPVFQDLWDCGEQISVGSVLGL